MLEFKKIEDLTTGDSAEYDLSYLFEYMISVEDMGGDASLGICHGCGVVMIKEGDFSPVFSYPEALFDDSDVKRAAEAVFEYCRDNEIPPSFIDVPLSGLPDIMAGVNSAEVEGDGEYFNVSVKTPPMSLNYPPEAESGGVYLGELTEDFAEKYKELITDGEHNKYTGYDVRRDMADAPAEYFIEEAWKEFRRGVSITLAASVVNEGVNVFIGEGVLYRFDGRGECEISFRILPEYCGKGFSKKIISALIEIAGNIGIRRVVARIMEKNIPAVGAARKFMTEESRKDGIITYTCDI